MGMFPWLFAISMGAMCVAFAAFIIAIEMDITGMDKLIKKPREIRHADKQE